MRYVLTHAEHGIYLGSFIGLGFWSLLDCAGQDVAVTFEDIESAQMYIATWDDQIGWTNDIVIESTHATSEYVTPEQLIADGFKTEWVAPLFFERESNARQQHIKVN